MQYGVYSVRDVKVGFGALTLDNNVQSAARNFAYGVSNGLANFAIDDYALYHVGDFDLESGALVTLPVPEFVVSGREALAMYKRG